MSRTRIIDSRREFQCEIPDFLARCADGKNIHIENDSFPFARDLWYFTIRIWTGAGKEILSVTLGRKTHETECNVQCTVGFKKADGQLEGLIERTNVTFQRGVPFEWLKCVFFSSEAIKGRSSELLPSGMLTIVWTLRIGDSLTDMTGVASVPCRLSLSEGSSNSVDVSTQTELENLTTRCHRSSSTATTCTAEASTQTQSEICMDKLSDDLSQLMTSGDESDFTVTVQGEEFRLHRNVLAARTPVFQSMLRHNMKEKATGVVCIDDCEPDIFRLFVRFVYSGRVDEISTDTVFRLYALADKYQVDDLKPVCVHFVERTLSVDTFCDAVRLAVTYRLRNLLEQATVYFSENTVAIIQTVKWLCFMKDCYVEANELYLKATLKNNVK